MESVELPSLQEGVTRHKQRVAGVSALAQWSEVDAPFVPRPSSMVPFLVMFYTRELGLRLLSPFGTEMIHQPQFWLAAN